MYVSLCLLQTDRAGFASPVSPSSLEKAAKGVIPTNTEPSTEWACKNFDTLAKNRAHFTGGERVPAMDNTLRLHAYMVPADLLDSHDVKL
jgi:hypothetical protein